MIDDLAMNAYLRGYIAALRNRHRPDALHAPENPYVDPGQRAGWLEGFRDALEEFHPQPKRQSA
jgi:ribosome modulation factor